VIKWVVDFFGEAKWSKVRWRLLIATLAVIVIADFLVVRDHGEFFWDYVPGWSAGFGFVSCFAIIFVSKFFGHQGRVMRDEDYYD
jgi:hypothetical protein